MRLAITSSAWLGCRRRLAAPTLRPIPLLGRRTRHRVSAWRLHTVLLLLLHRSLDYWTPVWHLQTELLALDGSLGHWTWVEHWRAVLLLVAAILLLLTVLLLLVLLNRTSRHWVRPMVLLWLLLWLCLWLLLLLLL